jgi:hypothetical protein
MKPSFANPFARKSKLGYPDAVGRLKEQVRRHLNLTEEVAISVAELNCRDSDCPGTETVIAILTNGQKPRLARIHKLLLDVTLKDLEEAFAGSKGNLM